MRKRNRRGKMRWWRLKRSRRRRRRWAQRSGAGGSGGGLGFVTGRKPSPGHSSPRFESQTGWSHGAASSSSSSSSGLEESRCSCLQQAAATPGRPQLRPTRGDAGLKLRRKHPALVATTTSAPPTPPLPLSPTAGPATPLSSSRSACKSCEKHTIHSSTFARGLKLKASEKPRK